MTRISTKYTFTVVAAGLLAAGTASLAVAQQNGAERYARTLADADITARYNVQIEQQLRSQDAQIASLEEQIAGMDATALDMGPMLERMFDELAQFVNDDVPFFADERSQRIERLRELMARVDAPVSEKFRRLIEAYQIEMEYGRTMSAYKARSVTVVTRSSSESEGSRCCIARLTAEILATGTTSKRPGYPILTRQGISRRLSASPRKRVLRT